MVRNHDPLQEIPIISDVHPTSYDVDNDDDDDEAATYTIAHINTTDRNTGPVVLNYSNRRVVGEGGRTDVLGNEKNNERRQQQQPTVVSTTAIPTKQLRNSFTAWKRKKDSKIVGLKHYGLESPRHQLHNILSDLDDHDSSHGKCHATQHQFTSLPKRNMLTWWMGDSHHPHHHSYRNKNSANNTSNENHTTSIKHQLFAVEKEEERVRKNVTKNPFVLFYLGNLAALKILIYYFSKFFVCHICFIFNGAVQ